MTIKYTGENQELLGKALPYVYVGERRIDGRIYIGARCANVRDNRNVIDDFGIKYFTSSPNVIFDEFDWEILFIGNDKKDVFEFEGELIDAYLKLGVLINKKGTKGWSTGGRPLSEEAKQKMSASRKGKPLSAEHKQSMSKARRGEKRKPCSEETKANISKGKKGKKQKPLSAEHKQKISESSKGKKLSEETKQKMSENRKGKKKGPLSDASKANISKGKKGKPQTIITCPHCGRSGGNAMKHYHFNNCKSLKHIETSDMRTS
jgi:hypothetical protein